MARLILLDSGPLWLAAGRRSKPDVVLCLAWIKALSDSGSEVIIPEITDYEVRRELTRRGIVESIARLDALTVNLRYDPISTESMRRAADFWALLRNQGRPTAAPEALDADAILAGQAAVAGWPGDEVIVATTNVGHLGRFPGVDARDWRTVAP